MPFWKGRGLGSGLRTLPQGRDRWGKNSTAGRLHPSLLRREGLVRMWSPPWLRRDGVDRKKQHCRAVTSLALLERARAWEWVKDPPAGEGQVGQKVCLGSPKRRSSRGRKSSPGITLLFFDRKTKARLLSQETSPRTQVSTAAYHELDCVIIIIIYEMCYIS